jgi:hypothetical protein
LSYASEVFPNIPMVIPGAKAMMENGCFNEPAFLGEHGFAPVTTSCDLRVSAHYDTFVTNPATNETNQQ